MEVIREVCDKCVIDKKFSHVLIIHCKVFLEIGRSTLDPFPKYEYDSVYFFKL